MKNIKSLMADNIYWNLQPSKIHKWTETWIPRRPERITIKNENPITAAKNYFLVLNHVQEQKILKAIMKGKTENRSIQQ